VLRLRKVELTFKGEVEKLRYQLHIVHNGLQAVQSESLTLGRTPEALITVDWEEFDQIAPERACCITAAEAADVEPDWTIDGDNASQHPAPPIMWADTLAEMPLLEANKSSEVAQEGTGIHGTPLSPEMGVEYILQYEPRASLLRSILTSHD
jgi:hypothetical protein